MSAVWTHINEMSFNGADFCSGELLERATQMLGCEDVSWWVQNFTFGFGGHAEKTDLARTAADDVGMQKEVDRTT